MPEITANVVVTNPRPIFTATRSFKALANGRVYIGIIDTDPTIPANQIPVYLENEDGSHIQIPQPLIINAGGKIVYNGNVTKVVTQQGHSMAVYDAYGSLEDYIPNILMYDPDRFQSRLADTTDVSMGDALVGVRVPLAGGVQRNQHLKNFDTITVEDFGAVGDGLNDDTAAIQAAMDSGACLITSSSNGKKYYLITNTLVMSKQQVFDLNHSELYMVDSTGLKSHILISGGANKVDGPAIRNVTLTNKYSSTVYQITANYVGGLVVEDCLGYCDGKAFGFLDVYRCIVANIRRNTVSSPVDTAVRAKGKDNGADRAVDFSIYDNRFVGGKHALRWGDYCEGLFFRRNICYAQTEYQLVIEPSSVDTGLVSGKIQDNDFDSPQTSNGGIYIQYYSNTQITGNWFANNSQDPMIRLESTDTTIIQGNQCYPNTSWLSDNGINTAVLGNIVSGGAVQIQFGSKADKTTVIGNHLSGASSYAVDANNHTKRLTLSSNYLEGANGGIASSGKVATHKYVNNTGDGAVGSGGDVILGASPATYKVGPRPEICSFKGGTITNISVNNTQMATNSNVVIGPLPPGSTLIVSYTGSTPGLTVMPSL
ncbi:phage tailspike protein [Pantoea stewartii]|uniref:phage tailspike protein n=1 Tax=Pantoea stewartii TaxID=66269 RepID=UPI002DB59FD2|nr:phage tailspike protein [Pantoea stewartii]MEB6533283.1 phage tailspike protein [Pantoea stewartii]